MKGQFFKQWGALGICFLLLTGCILFSGMVSSNRQSSLSEQVGIINGLENRKETLKASIDESTNEALKLASGLDSARVSKDDKAVEPLIEKVCTWDSKESYDKVRSEVKAAYKLEDDSTFLKVFLPNVKDINVGDRHINEIDAKGLNMSYVGMQSNVTNINGDLYTYLTVVTMESADSTGATAEGKALFVYTVDGKGEISNLSAYGVGTR